MKKGNTLPKDRKTLVGEAREKLDAIGHENEKEGIKWTQYFMNLWNQGQWQKNLLKQEKLEKKRRFSKRGYYQALSQLLQDELPDMDIPQGYMAWSMATSKGVEVWVQTNQGKKYYRAFTPDGTPSIDYNAVVGLLVDVQNSIDQLELQRQDNLKQMGLILP